MLKSKLRDNVILILFIIKLDEWHPFLKRYRLMESPHGELGSNSHIILDQKQVIEKKIS